MLMIPRDSALSDAVPADITRTQVPAKEKKSPYRLCCRRIMNDSIRETVDVLINRRLNGWYVFE